MAIKARQIVGPGGVRVPVLGGVPGEAPEVETRTEDRTPAPPEVSQVSGIPLGEPALDTTAAPGIPRDEIQPAILQDDPGTPVILEAPQVPSAFEVAARPSGFVEEPSPEQLQAAVDELISEQEKELTGPRREFFSVTHYQVLPAGIRVVEHSVYETDPRLAQLVEPPKFIPAGATKEQLKNLAAARWYPPDALRPAGYDPLRFRYAVVVNPDGTRSLVAHTPEDKVTRTHGKPARDVVIIKDTRELPEDAKFTPGQVLSVAELRRALRVVPQSVYYAIRNRVERRADYCSVRGVYFLTKEDHEKEIEKKC